MTTKFTYYDGNTHTPCRTRKQAIAFLIAQNGGEVRTRDYVVARIFDGNGGPVLAVRRAKHNNEQWTLITPEMRQSAQKEIGTLVPRKHYLIDFVYTDNSQQFGTEADLTPDEVEKLEAYLLELTEGGYITDPHVHEPGPAVHQTYAQARKEIAAAIQS